MAAKGRSGGVLPINAAVTKKEKSAQGQAKSSPRTQGPRLRLIVRRLPPGLTEAEFWTALGEEWQVGRSKVDWAAFKEGKVSKDPAKPSRPARGYLKVKDQSLLDELSAKIKQTAFQDAKNTTRDPCLIGPPSLEFAPYNKLASGRVRNDGRQGTIDQDQEFIDFLQSLTEPITKAAANGTDGDNAPEKVTTTPLVQYLKEKKANKAKEAAEKKNSKARQQQETKEGKQPKAEKSTVVLKGSASAAEKAKLAKATHETVKAINKSVAALQAKPAAPAAKTEEKPAAKSSSATTPSPAKRERERGSAAAAARLVQRDLGLTPRTSRSARTPSSATSTAQASATIAPSKAEAAPAVKTATAVTESKTTTTATPAATPPTGPRSTRNNANATTTSAAPAATPAAKSTPNPRAKAVPQPSHGAKSAFLKHANPSQGVTEDLLRAAFATFGTVTRCEIDKKKGLGYIDFEDAEGLRKAMAASPVKVGEKGGQVVVLENRNMAKSAKTVSGKNATSPAVAATTPAAQLDATPTASPKPAVATPAAEATRKAAVQTPAPNASAAPTPKDSAATPAPAQTPSESAPATPPTAPRGNTAGRAGTNARGGRGGQRGGFRGRGHGRGRGAAAGATPGQPPANPPAASTAPSAAASDAK